MGSEKPNHTKRRQLDRKFKNIKKPTSKIETKQAQINGEKVGKDKKTVKIAQRGMKKDVLREIREFSPAKKRDIYSTNIPPLQNNDEEIFFLEDKGEAKNTVKTPEIRDIFNKNSTPENGMTGDEYDIAKHSAGVTRKKINRAFRN